MARAPADAAPAHPIAASDNASIETPASSHGIAVAPEHVALFPDETTSPAAARTTE